MQKLLPIVIILVLTAFLSDLQAQSVTHGIISAGGGNSSTTAGSVEWTLGEPISETFTSASTVLTTGLHQPVLQLATAIDKSYKSEAFVAYPNPVRDELLVDFNGMKTGSYIISLVDVKGQLLFQKEIEVTKDKQVLTVSLAERSYGTYVLGISNRKDFNQSIKIEKAE